MTFIVMVVVLLMRSKRRRLRVSAVSGWVIYTVGVFAAIFFLVLGQECAGVTGAEGSPGFLDALFRAAQTFTMNRSIELDTQPLAWMGAAYWPYLAYNAAMFLAAPVGMVGVIVALVGQLLAFMRMRLRAKNRPVYVFSDITAQSLTLAESIGKACGSGKGCIVVFAGVPDTSASLAVEARSRGMICLPRPISLLAEELSRSDQQRTYVLSSDDEVANLDQGIKLAYDLAARADGNGPVPQVLVFSSSSVGGPIVDAVSAEINGGAGGLRVRIRRVDWVRSAIDGLLDSYPLFAAGIREECMLAVGSGALRFEPKLAFDYERDNFRIVVVGSGKFACEFVKGALWAGQLGDDISLHIDVVAGDGGAMESRLALDCPEIFAKDGRPYQDHYQVSFIEADPETDAYRDFLLDRDIEGGRTDVTYVLVALEDGLACASVARRTREILEQRRLRSERPVPCAFIAAVIGDSSLASGVRRMRARRRSYAIHPVGDDDSVFSYDSIFNLGLDGAAMNVNRIYSSGSIGGEGAAFERSVRSVDAFYESSEYCRRSSRASALHRKYALYLFCRKARLREDDRDWTRPLDAIAQSESSQGIEKSELLKEYESYLATEDYSWLAEVEHDRWSAYVAVEGQEFAGEADLERMWKWEGRHAYALGRLHSCLVKFDELPSLDKAVDAVSGGSPHVPFQQLDDDVLRCTGVIAASKATGRCFSDIWHEYFPESNDTLE